MYNRVYNTKAIIEAGLISALVVVIMLISVYVPIFSIFGTFILPIPITVLYIRHNYKVAISSVIVSGIIIGMTYSPISALSSTIMFGLTGLTLGYCIKHNKSFGRSIVLLAIASAIGVICSFLIYSSFVDKKGIADLINENMNILKESVHMNKELYEKAGISSEKLAPLNQMEKSLEFFTTDILLKLIPAVLIMMAFVSAFLNYSITSSILKKLKYDIKPIKPFSKWYINTRIGTFVVVFLIIGLLLDKKNIAIGGYFTNSAQILFQYILILDGISFAVYFLRNRFSLSKGVSTLILFFFMFSGLWIIFIYLGLADMILDFRKLDPYRRPKEE